MPVKRNSVEKIEGTSITFIDLVDLSRVLMMREVIHDKMMERQLKLTGGELKS